MALLMRRVSSSFFLLVQELQVRQIPDLGRQAIQLGVGQTQCLQVGQRTDLCG